MALSTALGSAYLHVPVSSLPNTRGPSARGQGLPCCPPLWYSDRLGSQLPSLPRTPQLCLLHAGSLPGSASAPPCTVVWKPPGSQLCYSWGATLVSLLGFTVLRCLVSMVLETLDSCFLFGGRSGEIVSGGVSVWSLSLPLVCSLIDGRMHSLISSFRSIIHCRHYLL